MRTILTVSVDNFLSFRKSDVTLGPLNVLVGPNGAGKTNFLKIFHFLGDVARLDLGPAIEGFGGYGELRFRGKGSTNDVRISLQGLITKASREAQPDEYGLLFREHKQRTSGSRSDGTDTRLTGRTMITREESLLFRRRGSSRVIALSGRSANFVTKPLTGEFVGDKGLSVQEQSSGLNTIRKLGEDYDAPEVEALAQVFETCRQFEANVARIRLPSQQTTATGLAPDGSNVAYFLRMLAQEHQAVFERLCDDIRFVLPGFENFMFTPVGGADDAIRLDIKERHIAGSTSLARASFGTIRAIAMFAMLHDPRPPRLTCIEEIDHGFHPHALDRIVERLREASEKTQIIVATHSPALVNRLTPEELIVFERDADTGATRIVDLDPAQTAEMERVSGYRMGELWFSGALGGGLGQED
jgi:predicted ATPase